MARQLYLMDESCKIHRANVQDVKMMYTIDELIKCLSDEQTF